MKTKNLFKTLFGFLLSVLMLFAIAFPLSASLTSGTTLTASAEIIGSNNGNYLELSNDGKSNGAWNIVVKNNTGKTVDVLYNETMCFSSGAKDWGSLDNITYYKGSTENRAASLANGQSVTIPIRTAGTAGYVTFSYIENEDHHGDNNATRYITWAHYLTSKGGISVGYARVNAEHYFLEEYTMDLTLIAQNKTADTKWIVKLTNIGSSYRNYAYNEKMCFSGDAQNFSSNLQDKKTIKLAPGESAYVSIFPNGTAGYITFSCPKDDMVLYIAYGHNLNSSTLKMSVSFTDRTI